MDGYDKTAIHKLTFQLIVKDFQLDLDDTIFQKAAFADELENWLALRVKRLLDQDFPFFLNALYRMDISEWRVKKIINNAPVDELPRLMAKEIIAREELKVITRLTYSSSHI